MNSKYENIQLTFLREQFKEEIEKKEYPHHETITSFLEKCDDFINQNDLHKDEIAELKRWKAHCKKKLPSESLDDSKGRIWRRYFATPVNRIISKKWIFWPIAICTLCLILLSTAWEFFNIDGKIPSKNTQTVATDSNVVHRDSLLKTEPSKAPMENPPALTEPFTYNAELYPVFDAKIHAHKFAKVQMGKSFRIDFHYTSQLYESSASKGHFHFDGGALVVQVEGPRTFDHIFKDIPIGNGFKGGAPFPRADLEISLMDEVVDSVENNASKIVAWLAMQKI